MAAPEHLIGHGATVQAAFRDFPLDTVLKVERRGDSLWDGFLIGAGVGFLFSPIWQEGCLHGSAVPCVVAEEPAAAGAFGANGTTPNYASNCGTASSGGAAKAVTVGLSDVSSAGNSGIGVLANGTPSTVIARTKALEQLKIIAAAGGAEDGFRKEHGGTGDVGAAVTTIEMLAMADLSLMVKAGVQWCLFGGAIENLGTERHHEAYVPKIINLDLLGCFAMTETGHGSDVQSLETTATVTMEKKETGWEVSESHLDLTARVPDADSQKFEVAANEAKAGCPISRLLNTKITMNARLATTA